MMQMNLGNLGAGLLGGVNQMLGLLGGSAPNGTQQPPGMPGSDLTSFSPEAVGMDPRQQRMAQINEELMEAQIGLQISLSTGNQQGAAEAQQRIQELQQELQQLSGGGGEQGGGSAGYGGLPNLGSSFGSEAPSFGQQAPSFGGGTPSFAPQGPAGPSRGGNGGGNFAPAADSPSVASNSSAPAGNADLGRLKTLQSSQVLSDGSLAFQAGAAIDVDGSGASHGDPCKQWQTSLTTKDGKSLNADNTPYFVLPPQVAKKYGIKPGDLGTISYNGKTIPAIFGDVGPKNKIGEVSRYAAQQLGINASPTSGGVSSGVSYNVFPGSGSRRPSAGSVTPQALAQRVDSHQTMLAQRSGGGGGGTALAGSPTTGGTSKTA